MKLERFAYTPFGTFGRLTIAEQHWYTIERPWMDNKPSISCIPEGVYPLRMDRFNKGGYDAFEIVGVPGRTEIKIHIATTMDDVLGCVGLGKELGFYKNKWAVIYNSAAFEEFMEVSSKSPDECSSIVIIHFNL